MRVTKSIMQKMPSGNRRDVGEDHPLVDAHPSSIGTHFAGPWVRVHALGTDGTLHTVRLTLPECDRIAAQAAWTREQIADG